MLTVDTVTIADDPAAWTALGFAVESARCPIGAVELSFVGDVEDRAGIVGWSLRGAATTDLDGLATTRSERPPAPVAPAHPNGVRAIDHIVAISPDLDRSVAALRAAGLDLRRIREEPTPAGAPRQAFFRLGSEILEVIQAPQDALARTGASARPLRFWGLAFIVDDLDRAAARIGARIGEIRPAVQRGRRIATLRRSAGLAVPVALISEAEDVRSESHASEVAGARG